jgi:hypothetical protein
VEADDVGHLVLIFPVVAEEGRIFFQDFRTTNGVIDTAEAEHSGGNQVEHTHHKVGKVSMTSPPGPTPQPRVAR